MKIAPDFVRSHVAGDDTQDWGRRRRWPRLRNDTMAGTEAHASEESGEEDEEEDEEEYFVNVEEDGPAQVAELLASKGGEDQLFFNAGKFVATDGKAAKANKRRLERDRAAFERLEAEDNEELERAHYEERARSAASMFTGARPMGDGGESEGEDGDEDGGEDGGEDGEDGEDGEEVSDAEKEEAEEKGKEGEGEESDADNDDPLSGTPPDPETTAGCVKIPHIMPGAKTSDRISIRLSDAGWILADAECGIRRLLDLTTTAKVKLKFDDKGFAYVAAWDAQTKARLYAEWPWVDEVLQCNLWEISGERFIEEYIGEEAVKRTWLKDAQREFVSMYSDRVEDTTPVKTMWFRCPRSTGYRAYYSLQTLGMQVSRSKQATPGFFGTV